MIWLALYLVIGVLVFFWVDRLIDQTHPTSNVHPMGQVIAALIITASWPVVTLAAVVVQLNAWRSDR